jgi:hypothetical protein
MPDTYLEKIAAAAARRRDRLRDADNELDVIAHLIDAAGEDANLVHASEAAKIPRSTLYRRLAALVEGSES